MGKLEYTRDELLQDSNYSQAHTVNGNRLHGGFDASGEYISPRTEHRWPAVRAWQDRLSDQKLPLLDASTDLLSEYSLPNAKQQKLLLQSGLEQTFWNSLTVTGVFEGRGKALCEIVLPNFQDIIVEDISEMCVGHLHKGMLYAHGADEGGDPEFPTIGAHDAMWYELRDLVFGGNAFPMPEIPETLSRPSSDPLFPQLSAAHAGLLETLLNLLMIEVRAESFFAICCDIFRDPSLFDDRREQANEAAEMIERIRTDEAIHTLSLQIALSEMRALTFKTAPGGQIKGSDLLDPAWEIITSWHGKELQGLNREATRERLHVELATLPDSDKLIEAFDRLEG